MNIYTERSVRIAGLIVMQTNQLATIKLYRGYFRFAFRLNTDFTELTDHDYHKAKGAFFQDGYSALVSASDGAGNSAMINVYPGLKGAIRTSWSEEDRKSVV